MPEAKARPRRRYRVLAALAAVLVALLAFEGLVRVRHYLKHGTFSPIYEFVQDPASGLRVPPVGVNGAISINSRHFRGPEIDVPKPEGRLRIAFLGGSTTFCAEASGDDKVWPHLVAQGLDRAFEDRQVDYVNGGAAGFDAGSSKINLEIRMRDLDPDLIVIYHATNDFSKEAALQAAEHGLDTSFDQDWLERQSMAWSLLKKNLLLRERSGDATEKLEIDLPRAVAAFESRMRALVESAKQHSEAVVLVTFAHRMRSGQSAEELRTNAATALLYVPFLRPEEILNGIDAFNEVLRKLATELDVVLVDDIARIPADSEHYQDSVHLTDRGCQAMAERVLAVLRDEPRVLPR